MGILTVDGGVSNKDGNTMEKWGSISCCLRFLVATPTTPQSFPSLSFGRMNAPLEVGYFAKASHGYAQSHGQLNTFIARIHRVWQFFESNSS
jgi:hypothetical protein